MIRVIGIYGKARSGKTTARKYLERYRCSVMSFADPLKNAIREIFGIPLNELYTDHKTDRTRWILQFFGTDCCREIEPDIWVRKTNEKIQELQDNGETLVVIDDVRFINEANMLLNNWNATLVKLVGPEDTETLEAHKQHISETQMDSLPDSFYSAVYRNTGTLEELYKFMETVLILSQEPTA